jgi:hypothetical protein
MKNNPSPSWEHPQGGGQVRVVEEFSPGQRNVQSPVTLSLSKGEGDDSQSRLNYSWRPLTLR